MFQIEYSHLPRLPPTRLPSRLLQGTLKCSRFIESFESCPIHKTNNIGLYKNLNFLITLTGYSCLLFFSCNI